MLYLNAVCRHAGRMFVVSLESFIYLPSLLIHNSSAEAFATVSHLWILWIYEYLCIKNPKSRFQANKWLCRCWTLSPVMFVKYVSLSCPLCITSISFGLPHVSLFLFVDFFAAFVYFFVLSVIHITSTPCPQGQHQVSFCSDTFCVPWNYFLSDSSCNFLKNTSVCLL